MTRTTQGNTLDVAAYRGPSWRAADERVTPRELAEAVAAVERRHAEPPRQDGRISLGEAVEQLGLDATPEELLAEVEVRRRTEALARFAQAQRRQRVRWCAAVLAAGTLWAGGVVGASQVQHRATVPTSEAPVALTPDAVTILKAAGNGSAVTTLAELPEGAVATVDTASLMRLLNLSGDMILHVRGGTRWQLFRRGETVYLRGHVRSAGAAYVTITEPVALENRPKVDADGKPTTLPLALPIGSFRVISTANPTFDQENQRLVIDYVRASVDKRAGAE